MNFCIYLPRFEQSFWQNIDQKNGSAVLVCLFVLRLNVPVNSFQSCRGGATASWVLSVLSGSKVSCSRTQQGGSRFRTPRSSTLYHLATAPPPAVQCIYPGFGERKVNIPAIPRPRGGVVGNDLCTMHSFYVGPLN